MRAAADAIKSRLRTYAGVYAIADSFRTGKEEVQLGIRPAAEALGLRLQDLGRQVRQAFYGEEAQRIQRGRDDIRVMVRYPRDERRSLADLENMRVRTPDGGEVPFGHVARVEASRGFASIRRIDRNRAVNVTASVDPEISSASAVIRDLRRRILPEVLADFPGVFYSFRGAQAAQEEAVEALRIGFLLSLVLIFALLAIPLGSYVQPFIIMGAIPFGLVGAFWGHLVMGLDVTVMSLFGFVALTGVVVNDSLVMVDFINRERTRGRAAGATAIATRLDPRSGGAGLERAIRRAGKPSLPSHPAHFADHLRRPGAPDARPQLAGGVLRADGGVAGVRGAVRHLHHAAAGADRLLDPRRPAAAAAPVVRVGSGDS